MRKSFGCVGWLAVVAWMAGCASVPDYRYFTLDMRPSGKVAAPARVGSVRVEVSQALARPEILIRTSPTQITYYALDRWASGLDEQLSEKLLTEFSDVPKDAPQFGVTVTLLAFEQVDAPGGAEVRVKLDLKTVRLGDGRGSVDFQKLYERTAPAPSAQPAAVVDALSRVVESIAGELAADLAAASANLQDQPR